MCDFQFQTYSFSLLVILIYVKKPIGAVSFQNGSTWKKAITLESWHMCKYGPAF